MTGNRSKSEKVTSLPVIESRMPRKPTERIPAIIQKIGFPFSRASYSPRLIDFITMLLKIYKGTVIIKRIARHPNQRSNPGSERIVLLFSFQAELCAVLL